jgi:hypothetical protein
MAANQLICDYLPLPLNNQTLAGVTATHMYVPCS